MQPPTAMTKRLRTLATFLADDIEKAEADGRERGATAGPDPDAYDDPVPNVWGCFPASGYTGCSMP
jgi:hypothetical protein